MVLTGKARFEDRSEGGEVVYQAQVWGSVLGRRNSQSKGPPVGMCLAWLRKSKEASVAGVEPLSYRVNGHEVSDVCSQTLWLCS